MSDSVKIDLELVTKAFEDSLKRATKQTQSFGDQAQTSFKKTGIAFGTMAGSLAASAVVKALGLIIDNTGRMIDEAVEAEKSFNQLQFALKAAGISGANAAEDMAKYAESLSQVTTFDDDLIISNQALLASLTKLSKDGINSAVRAAADLAATLNLDLTTATEMVAKAMNGNVASFGKMGIEIRKGATDAEQYANVMEALSRFSGAATAATNTFGGAMAQQNNAIGNLLGAMGELITKNPTVINGFKAITDTAISATEWINKNKDAMVSFSNNTVSAFSAAKGVLTDTKPQDTVAQLTTEIKFLEGSISAAKKQLEEYNAVERFMIGGDTQAKLDENIKLLEETRIKLEAATAAENANKTAVAESNVVKQQNLELKYAEIDAANTFTEALAKENENISANYQLQLEALNTFYGEKRLIDQTNDDATFQEKLDREGAYFEARNALIDQQYQIELDKINKSTLSEDQKNKARAAAQKRYEQESLKSQKDYNSAVSAEEKKQKEREIKDRTDTLSLFSTLAESSSKELAAIGKAAAIAQLGYQTHQAIGSAYAYGTSIGGPFLGATFAGIAGVAMAEQARKLGASPNISIPKKPSVNAKSPEQRQIDQLQLQITEAELRQSTGGTNPNIERELEDLRKKKEELEKRQEIARLRQELGQPAFANGGIVPGTSTTGDRVMARVNSGEMILNKSQQAKLFHIANGTRGGNTEAILERIANILESGSSTNINIDGREIINVVRNGLASGRSLT